MTHKDGVYLVVVDDSAEFLRALEYAIEMAIKNNGHVGLFYACETEEMYQWPGVGNRIKQEHRIVGEQQLWSVARRVYEDRGIFPCFYIAEESGDRSSALVSTLLVDPGIVQLVLAASDQEGRNPLISFFLSGETARIPIPIVIVPPLWKKREGVSDRFF